jgi:iron complex transport system permease protein
MARRTNSAYYVLLVGVLAAVVAAAMLLGQGSLSDPSLKRTLLELRATRVGAAFLAGAALAIGGVVVQGLFRNPLVDPSIIGTTAGAQLGGQLALLAFAAVPGLRHIPHVGPDLLLPMGCLVGATVSLAVVLAFARQHGGTVTLLLTGFILSSLFLSLGSFATSLAQDSWDVGRAVVAFTLGGVGGVGRRQLLLAVPLIAIGAVAAWGWARQLDLLLSGEEEAATLGVDVGQIRRWSIIWVAVITAAAVSVGGNVFFVGLIVPHVLRPVFGVRHRHLMPAAALMGGTFLVACDLIARLVPSQSEVPLGVVTGLVGAPVFLFLLARSRRELAHG